MFFDHHCATSGTDVFTASAEECPAATHSSVKTASNLAVKLQQVSIKFGALTVLENLNLDIQPGSFVAIVGRSGCGKSTLLRLISGLEQPDNGTVYYDDQIHRGLNGHARFMFQEARLLPWKRVPDNVCLGLCKAKKDRALQALKHIGLEAKAHEWPSVLSGGQRQRVALARALVHEPKLLLLDEPLGALDALTRIEMQQLIERIWLETGFTAILVTNDISEAVTLADRVILLDSGKIDLDITIDLPRPRHRDKLIDSQWVTEITPDSFISRRGHGEYIRWAFQEAVDAGHPDVKLDIIHDEVTGLQPSNEGRYYIFKAVIRFTRIR